jgi:hypothetical protein
MSIKTIEERGHLLPTETAALVAVIEIAAHPPLSGVFLAGGGRSLTAVPTKWLNKLAAAVAKLEDLP